MQIALVIIGKKIAEHQIELKSEDTKYILEINNIGVADITEDIYKPSLEIKLNVNRPTIADFRLISGEVFNNIKVKYDGA